MEGERIAFKIIQTARDERNSKVQDAQFEAKQELAIIKQKMNSNFDEFKAKKDNEQTDLQSYEDQATADIVRIRAQFEKNRENVGAILTEAILNVKLDLPKVVIGNFEEMDQK